MFLHWVAPIEFWLTLIVCTTIYQVLKLILKLILYFKARGGR